MRMMVLVKACEASEQDVMPAKWAADMMDAMGRFNDELRAAGVFVMAEGLAPSSAGRRVVFDGPARHVLDGPFVPVEELVAGFWLWDVQDMAEALAWAKRCPNPMPGPRTIEIRPMHGAG